MKIAEPAAQTEPAPDDISGRVDVFALLSHEIRTPLNGVLGMAGLLAATPLDSTQSAYLQTLRECGEHLLGLVNDVLDLAKLQSGRVELEPAPTDLEKLIQGVCELLSPRAHEKGLEIGWAVDAGAPTLVADDGRLRQILFNLIGNAVKMTEAGGVLALAEVRGAPAASRVRVRFSVEDTGPGVGEADAARIFQPFVQTRTGERAGGAGLGLAVVRRLADAFGGELGVEAGEGGGARFWFEAEFAVLARPEAAPRLAGATIDIRTASPVLRRAARLQLEACGARAARPGEVADAVLQDGDAELVPAPVGAPPTLVMLAPEDRGAIPGLRAKGYAGYLIKPLRRVSLAERLRAALDAGRRPAVRKKARAAPTLLDEREAGPASGLGLRVLLAEDNAVNALLASALLTRRGCGVVRVGSGAEALATLADGTFDLVLMDMRMPGMSGLEATRAIRAAGRRVPIVALTANAFEDDRRACLEAGMDDFLSKPLDPAALDALFARLFSSSASLAAPAPVTK